MKHLFTTTAMLFSMIAFAQVGINNTSPKATLDITAKTNGTKPEGLIIPQLSGSDIRTATTAGVYGTAQKGLIVYASAADSAPAGATASITAPGYYYFDGSAWQKMNGTATTDATTTAKGIVQLAGDLTGSAASPTIASNAVTSTKIANGAVTTAKIQGSSTNGQVLTTNGSGVTSWATPVDNNTTYTAGSGLTLTGTFFSANDATTSSKGIVQLAGDLTGSAASPTIASGAVTSSKIANDAVTSTQIANGAVSNADLANAAALTVKGNATNAAASPTDIAAGTDGYVLRRSGTALGFGTVATAGIADGAVTANKMTLSNGKIYVGNSSGAAAEVSLSGDVTMDNTGAASIVEGKGGIYKGNGALSKNTSVNQGGYTLAFTSNTTNGFSVDGTTLSVDGANNRVGIGTNTPYATLDITAKAPGTSPEGLLIPKLSGTEIQNGPYGTNQIGTLVYATAAPSAPNTVTAEITEAGFYYFNGTRWKKINSSGSTISYTTIADPNILGYVPSTTATASVNAPVTLTVGTATATRRGTGSFGGHTYASYSASGSVTWYEAYNAAKNMGGYLAVFTSDAEWQYVETYLLTPYPAFDTNGGHIGMARFSWGAGSGLVPDPEMKWITGEQPNHDYSAGGTGAVRKSGWFAPSQPEGGSEGFVVFAFKNGGSTKVYNGYTSTHPWHDVTANLTGIGLTGGFIVEFQQ